jgi:hypothetical protein
MSEHKAPRNAGTEPPSPLDFPVKDPLRGAYQGRWKQLPLMHKIGLIVVLGFLVAFIATVVFAAERAQSLGSLLPVLAVATVLGRCFFCFEGKRDNRFAQRRW